jgi:hypothetical protein
VPAAPNLSAAAGGIKTIDFSWAPIESATIYRLLADPDGRSGFAQIGNDLGTNADSVSLEIPAHLTNWEAARYQLQACNDVGCSESGPISIADLMFDSIGYFKASNAEAEDWFGRVALSGDGKTMAIGAVLEDGGAAGIDGDESDNSSMWAGAVYVFVESDGIWTQQAYLKASNPDAQDRFGSHLAITADGNTLAVGAVFEDSDGDPIENNMPDSGAVYVFRRNGSEWSEEAYIKQRRPVETGAQFSTVALDADGNRLAVGAPRSGLVDGNITTGIGVAYIFDREESGEWFEVTEITSDRLRSGDFFGSSLSLTDDGETLAVGAPGDDSTGLELDNDAPNAGAVYVFRFDGERWVEQSYLKASNAEADDGFGANVAFSGDGSRLAVASREDSSATGVDGDQQDNDAPGSGAVYVFVPDQQGWSQEAYIKASNTGELDVFQPIALNRDGTVLVVGAAQEDSAATGVDGDADNDDLMDSGAAYVYERRGGQWIFRHYLKAPNTGEGDLFGVSVSLSDDGDRLAVGATYEDGPATGIGGDQGDNPGELGRFGAAYLY